MADGERRADGTPGRRTGLLVLTALLVGGCSLFTPEPELLERWDRYAVADTSGLVRVDVFTARSPASGATPALSRMSPSAQAAYVRAMGISAISALANVVRRRISP